MASADVKPIVRNSEIANNIFDCNFKIKNDLFRIVKLIILLKHQVKCE
jgi:hypothetical protein